MECAAHEIVRNPEVREESRRIRRLQMLVRLSFSAIAEGRLTYDEASALVAATRKSALDLFPGKDSAFEVLYQPRFRQLLAWKLRLQ